jgi:hypothetical protein
MVTHFYGIGGWTMKKIKNMTELVFLHVGRNDLSGVDDSSYCCTQSNCAGKAFAKFPFVQAVIVSSYFFRNPADTPSHRIFMASVMLQMLF